MKTMFKAMMSAVLLTTVLGGLSAAQSTEAATGQNLTETQKAESRAFPEYKSSHNITELASKGSGDILVNKQLMPGSEGGLPGETTLMRLAAHSDLVVMGRLQSQSSHLMDHNEFIFTEYRMVVDKVAKDTTKRVTQGMTVIVSRGGGDLTVNGRPVHAVDAGFRPFNSGQHYVLFLKRIPQVNAYKATVGTTFHVLDDGALETLGQHVLYTGLPGDADSLWTDVLAARGRPGIY